MVKNGKVNLRKKLDLRNILVLTKKFLKSRVDCTLNEAKQKSRATQKLFFPLTPEFERNKAFKSGPHPSLIKS